jgi:hypothetical protein
VGLKTLAPNNSRLGELMDFIKETPRQFEEPNQRHLSKPQTRLDRAQLLVFDYVKSRLEKTDTHVTFSIDEVYIVWFSKTLQNWKALLSTTLPDGMYYEVTYNGDKEETYIDAYKKFENVRIPD